MEEGNKNAKYEEWQAVRGGGERLTDMHTCSLVAVVFKDTALKVNPVFQLHPEAILIFPRMCGSVN